MSHFIRRLLRLRPDPTEIDLRACIGSKDPVDWFQRAKLEKRQRYVMTMRDREIARGRAALEPTLPFPFRRQAG